MQKKYPILGGVALLVADVRGYLMTHTRGIAPLIEFADLPKEFQKEFRMALDEIQNAHIDEDLESERVTALYLMNHYLSVSQTLRASEPAWWTPISGEPDPLMDRLVREHWDHGPFEKIEKWNSSDALGPRTGTRKIVELGCGVGGLSRRLKGPKTRYLGVDSSFASIALARHLCLDATYPRALTIPEDLLQGAVSRRLVLKPQTPDGHTDFIVADANTLSLKAGEWDVALSLNMIDMLDDPEQLPRLMEGLLKRGGVAVQSAPYVWHPEVAKRLRKRVGPKVQSSSEAAERLFTQNGFSIEERHAQVPWLFFKHVRQLELYSVHMFRALKA